MNDDLTRIDELQQIMVEHGLDALKVSIDDKVYELVRREPHAGPLSSAAPPPAAQQPVVPAAPSEVAGANAQKIAAPIIGVFYRSSAPGTEPFVEVGDRVGVGQVLCILEAMKMMNEITSDHAGIVTRILPENGQLVSLGEEMFWIEP
jgi:acetyl-CoA carboxylase biotin carboxyl carrier protein